MQIRVTERGKEKRVKQRDRERGKGRYEEERRCTGRRI